MKHPAPSASLELRFPGHGENVRKNLLRLRVWTTSLQLCAESRGDVELVLAEIVNNIVEHAQHGCLNDEILIHGELLENSLAFQIVDYGAPLPFQRIPEGIQPSLDVGLQDLPEGGFGWMLVRTLTSELHYERRAGANCLSLCFALRHCE